MIVSTAVAQRRALFLLALTLALGGIAVRDGNLGGRARSRSANAAPMARPTIIPAESAARAAALKQCKGDCTAVTMKRACAALSVDMTNPCGPHGYAVKPQISSSLNEATRKCYEFGGKECVIRAWACDAKG